MQLSLRDKLAFPAGCAAEFDASHFAVKGGAICRFAGVAMGGSFVELQTGMAGVMQGTASSEINGLIGRSIRATAAGEYVSFTGLPRAIVTNETAFTLAAIFKCGLTTLGRRTLIGVSTTTNTGIALGLGTGAGQPYVAGPGQSEDSFTNLPLFVVGHSYFFAATAASKAVLVDLGTGATSTDTGLAISTVGTPNGVYAIANSGNGNAGFGSVAAACHINKNLSMQELLQWADDPWKLWYKNADQADLLTPSTSFVPSYPSIIRATAL